MAQVNAGRVRFVSRGEYNNSTQYYLFDLVDYEGGSYFAKENTLGNFPTDITKWQLIAEKGKQGERGIQGLTGNGIESIVKTGTSGLVDTYTITFTDGTTTTFEITNGEDGEVTQAQLDATNRMVEQSKLVYNALPKVNGSGEEITLNNTAETPLGITLKGNTYQETTTGKNLLPPFGAKSGTNVDVTSNEYEITVDGTSNNNASIYSDNQITLPAGTYSLCKKYVSGSVDATFLYILRAVGGSTNIGEVSVGATTYENDVKSTFTLAEETTLNQYLYIGTSGRNYSAYKMNVQIVSGSEADYNYEPYTNGASPNPSYPQEVQVVTGDNTIKVQNKNLFDKNNANILNGYFNTVSANTITFSNSAKTLYIPCEPNTTYTISKTTSARFYAGYTTQIPAIGTEVFGIIGENDRTTPITITTGENTTYIVAFIYLSSVDTLTLQQILDSIQIEKSSTATDYVEHKEQNYPINLGTLELCKIPNTDYQDIIKRSTGKNLFDKSTATTQVGYFNASGNVLSGGTSTVTTSYHKIIPNTDLTISGFTVNRICFYDKNKNFIERSEVIGTTPYTFNKNAYYIRIQAETSVFDLDTLQIEQGSTATYYEPYGVGNWYKYKAIGKVVLDGTEDWAYQYANGWYTTIENIKPVSDNNTQPFILCNYYEKGSANQVFQRNYGIAQSANSSKIIIKNIDMANATALKSWLSEHNTTVYYALETPTGELITAPTLIEQLNNLYYAYAYQGQTNINQENSNLASLMNAETTRDLSDIFTNEE